MNTNIYTEKKTETACSRKEENEKKKHFDGNEIERKRESQTTTTKKMQFANCPLSFSCIQTD